MNDGFEAAPNTGGWRQVGECMSGRKHGEFHCTKGLVVMVINRK